MKRAMTGGTHRGPVGLRRQRRTLRIVQWLFVIIACVFLIAAGYSWGRVRGYDDAQRSDELGSPRRPSQVQTIALGLLGVAGFCVALLLQGSEGVRLPVPARLEELAGRAEAAAVERAEAASGEEPGKDRGGRRPRSRGAG